MARRISPATALDFFATPPWATRALVREVLRPEQLADGGMTALDPCCGAGHMAIPLAESFAHVEATDVHDWGFGVRRDLDFSMATRQSIGIPVNWLIANPPFNLAERFLDRGLAIADAGVALLLRLPWLEGTGRYERIFGTARKPSLLCPFAERVPMIEGCWDPEATSATAYAWFIWTLGEISEFGFYRRTQILHIRPGMAEIYSRLSDEALANRGEAARRRRARKAA